MTATSIPPRRTPLFAVAIAALPLIHPLNEFWRAALRGGLDRGWWTYTASVGSFNYLDFGFIRRGLPATLARLIDADPMVGTAVLFLITLATFGAICAVLLARYHGARGERAIFGLLLLALLWRLALDIGRADTFTLMLGALAAIAVCADRWLIATGLCALSLMGHETGVIVIAPLLAAIALRRGTWRQISLPKAAAIGVIMAVSVAAYLFGGEFHGDPAHAAQIVRSRFLPYPPYYEMGIYFSVSGARGLRAAICSNQIDPHFWVQVACGLVLIVLAVAATRPRLWLALLASVPAYLFLCSVASDVGRWGVMAGLSVWLFAILTNERDANAHPPLWRQLAGIAAALFIFPVGHRVVWAPSPIVDAYVQARGPKTLFPDKALDVCDPGWRALIQEGRR